MKIRKFILFICAFAIFLSGCGKEDYVKKIRVSEVTHSIFYAPLYVALNNGYFERKGIEIDLVNAGGADKVMTALLTDAADIGLAGAEAAVYVYSQGKEDYPKVFAQLTQCDGSFIVGRENKNFEWKDLKGKTILPGRKGGMPYMTLLYCLNQNGFTVGKDVFFDDSVSFNAMTGAFVSGTGDYVTAFEPSATMLEKEKKGFILASVGEEGGRVPYTTFLASSGFMDENKDLIQRFTDAVYKGQQFVYNSTPYEIAQAIAPSFPDTDIETIAEVVTRYKEINAYSENGKMSEEDFARLCDILENAGELADNIEFDDIVDNTFAEKSIK